MAEASLSEDGSPFTDRAQGFVAVAAAHRRQGLGTRLAAEVDRFAATAGVRWLETETLERDLAASLPLLQKRGFKELERYQTSRQRPATVNLSRLDELRSRFRRAGQAPPSGDRPRVEDAGDSLGDAPWDLGRAH